MRRRVESNLQPRHAVVFRYFDGVQGVQGKQGELFGLQNIFKLQKGLTTKLAVGALSSLS